MHPGDAEVWECRSQMARSLIARHMAFSFPGSLVAWLHMLLFCALCCVGLRGCSTTLLRPTVTTHLERRRKEAWEKQLERDKELSTQLASALAEGEAHLKKARQFALHPGSIKSQQPQTDMGNASQADSAGAVPAVCAAHSSSPDAGRLKPHRSRRRSGSDTAGNSTLSTLSTSSNSSSNSNSLEPEPWRLPPQPNTPPESQQPNAAHTPQQGTSHPAAVSKPQQEDGHDSSAFVHAAHTAYQAFVRAVHLLQTLVVRPDSDSIFPPPATEESRRLVLPEEQAQLYSWWAESVLLKYRCGIVDLKFLHFKKFGASGVRASRLPSVLPVRRPHNGYALLCVMWPLALICASTT